MLSDLLAEQMTQILIYALSYLNNFSAHLVNQLYKVNIMY